mmetsp:Transcript_13644/g.43593  ORF Transcript_13644/g.43593 Transcript_13644/m.43593 type:complete len:271 (-) Transcript_13644:261-1073(-)
MGLLAALGFIAAMFALTTAATTGCCVFSVHPSFDVGNGSIEACSTMHFKPWGCHQDLSGQAVFRVALHTVLDELLELVREFTRQAWRLALHDRLDHIHGRQALCERVLSGGQLDQHQSQRPNVGRVRVVVASDALGGHVLESAHVRGARADGVLKVAADAKVGQLHTALRIHQNVLGLDVTVDALGVLQVAQPPQHLVRGVRQHPLGETAAVLLHRPTVHELQRDADGALPKVGAVEPHQAQAVGIQQDAHFTQQLVTLALVKHVDHLDC